MTQRTFTQSVDIAAPPETVDRCIVSPETMPAWLNPLLKCESAGDWSVEVGSQFRFAIQVPLLNPTLDCTVRERHPGLVVWSFEGFFNGTDRWECLPQNIHGKGSGTHLVNTFTFEIPNPFVEFGFNLVAAKLTQRDMQAQLQRLKAIAEQDSASKPSAF